MDSQGLHAPRRRPCCTALRRLGKFYECLLECKQLHLRDTYPMAMQQRLPKYADSSLSDWVDVLRQKTRDSLDAPRTPVTPLDQGPGPKGAAFGMCCSEAKA